MGKYEYTEDMGEISGFGGGYEAACRAMVVAGLEWLDEQESADPRFHGYENIYGIVIADNEDAERLHDAMLEASGGDATGAMMQACTGHVLAARRLGWGGYVEKMTEKKLEKGR